MNNIPIDISINIQIDNECIICMNEFKDDFIILDCCNKHIHIQCLHNWIEINHSKNIYKKNCPHCKQINNLICFISNYDNKIINNNYINEDIRQNQIIQQRILNNNRFETYKKILIVSTIIYLLFMITYFPILILYK